MVSPQSPRPHEAVPGSNVGLGLEVYQEAPIPVFQPRQDQTVYPYYNRGGAAWSLPDPAKKKRLWDPQARRFWVLLFIILLISVSVIGGGIGGWVSVQNSNRKKACEAAALSASTPTRLSGQDTIVTPLPTTTTADGSGGSGSSSNSTTLAATTVVPTAPFTVVEPTIIPTLATPENYNTSFQSVYDDTSRYFKYYDKTNIYGYDIAGNIAYSFQQCVQACLTLNYFGNLGPCRSVTFRIDLAYQVTTNHGANCFLKGIAPQKAEISDAKSYSARICLNSSCAEYDTINYDGSS